MLFGSSAQHQPLQPPAGEVAAIAAYGHGRGNIEPLARSGTYRLVGRLCSSGQVLGRIPSIPGHSARELMNVIDWDETSWQGRAGWENCMDIVLVTRFVVYDPWLPLYPILVLFSKNRANWFTSYRVVRSLFLGKRILTHVSKREANINISLRWSLPVNDSY